MALKVKAQLAISDGGKTINLDLDPIALKANALNREEVAEEIGSRVADAIGWLPNHDALRSLQEANEKLQTDLEELLSKPKLKPATPPKAKGSKSAARRA